MTDADRWERSARFWLRAYPRRWRAVRADEVLAVLMDLAAPGARRLGVRTAFDLLRGGWATRWREHPPLWTWFTYRWDKRIPARHRAWAADDIDGRLYQLRQTFFRIGYLLPLYLILFWQSLTDPSRSGLPSWFWLSFIVVLFVVLPLLSLTGKFEGTRSRARQRHLAAEAGEPLGPGVYVAQPARRPRVRASRGAVRAVLGLALGAVLSGAGAVLAPKAIGTMSMDEPGSFGFIARSYLGMAHWVGLALVVALGSGVLRARRADRRLRRGLALRPEQPNRVLTGSNGATDVRVVVGLLAVAGDAWLEASGRLVLLFSPVIAVLCLVTLPWAIALARYRDDVAGLPEPSWSDLRAAAGSGAPPPVDLPMAVVVPYEGSAVPGAVVEVWPWRGGPVGPPWPPAPA